MNRENISHVQTRYGNKRVILHLKTKYYCKRVADLLMLQLMKFEARRILATLLLFVSITGLVVSFGETVLCAGELPVSQVTINAPHQHDMPQVDDSNCPCPPSPSDSQSDHFCDGDCGCPCHAPLPSGFISFNHSRSFTCLFHVDVTRHIPEVYISLFVPPDSATV